MSSHLHLKPNTQIQHDDMYNVANESTMEPPKKSAKYLQKLKMNTKKTFQTSLLRERAKIMWCDRCPAAASRLDVNPDVNTTAWDSIPEYLLWNSPLNRLTMPGQSHTVMMPLYYINVGTICTQYDRRKVHLWISFIIYHLSFSSWIWAIIQAFGVRLALQFSLQKINKCNVFVLTLSPIQD